MKAEYQAEVIDFIRTIDNEQKIELSYALNEGLKVDVYLRDVNSAINFHSYDTSFDICIE